MVDDRYRYDEPRGGYGNRDRDDGRDFGSGRDYGYSRARDYQAAGQLRDRDDRNFRGGGTGYGGRDDFGGYQAGGFDRDRDRSRYGGTGGSYGGQSYRGSYASDGHRFTDTGSRGDRDHGRRPEGYDYQDRGFLSRAGDEVRSWFGDDEAERRREYDQRYDERSGGGSSRWASAYSGDSDYHGWRQSQIEALDRDYDEYRRENGRKFENEFGSWRAARQTQRTSLQRVDEHMEVVGSDGEHVGTVDKVRGDRVVLTKTDTDAGGSHHSFPSSWIQSVDDKVTLTRTGADAKRQWRDEERSSAFFGSEDRDPGRAEGRVDLNRSFSGTY